MHLVSSGYSQTVRFASLKACALTSARVYLSERAGSLGSISQWLSSLRFVDSRQRWFATNQTSGTNASQKIVPYNIGLIA